MLRHLKTKPVLKWVLTGVAVFFGVLLLVSVPYIAYANKYQDRIFPRTRIGQLNLAGLTKNEARQLIEQKTNQIIDNGITFEINGQKKTIQTTITSLDADLAIQIVSFDIDQTVEKVFSYGRTGGSLRQFQEQIRAVFFDHPNYLLFSIDNEELKNVLQDAFGTDEKPAQNAQITFQEGQMVIKPEKSGTAIDYNQASDRLADELSSLDSSPIPLSIITEQPTVFEKDLSNTKTKIDELLAKTPVTIKYPKTDIEGNAIPAKKNKWTIDKNVLASWVTTDRKDGEIVLGLSDPLIHKFLDEKVSPDIVVKMNEARFKIVNGKVAEFQASRNGMDIEATTTINNLKKTILDDHKQETELALVATKTTVKESDVNNLGITEIIGTGQSNFSGSPSNRRHNIKTGAYAVNGLLIKPGEEFSMIRALGRIDGTSGYLPELVIKENKTIPEYGGGLCQVGTTMFRAALASGLPITARRNHSYRVPYYEPAGTDATIYDPQPDLRFVNDTGSYILIQTRMSGNYLYFDLWGTKDGRKITQTYPAIYNIKSPPPTKLVETTSLPVGKKKCTERAHKGADAYFDYTVVYPGGEKKYKRFTSHYVPWQEVCLIGVDKLTSPDSATTDKTTGQKTDNSSPTNPSAPATTDNKSTTDGTKDNAGSTPSPDGTTPPPANIIPDTPAIPSVNSSTTP